MIVICLASRGLIFTEVEDSIEKARQNLDIKVLRCWNKQIPEAQNFLVEEALKTDCDFMLFVEEDTVLPKNAISDMVNADADIAFIDYGVNGWSCSAKDRDGEILWCGLGCTLIKRHVFEKLKAPWFRDDMMLRLNDWQWVKTNKDKVYGGHDIWFSFKAREAKFKLFQVPGECKHLKLATLGRPEVNKGLHEIGTKLKIEKQQIIEKEGE